VDHHASSAFRDRIYVTWTRFLFNAHTRAYVQSPIAEAHSSDGGKTFSSPQLIAGNVLYGQGSHPAVGPDGTVYVFWDGSTRLATFDSIWMVKSKDGGVNWSKPVKVADLIDIIPIANTAFRNNSYPAATVAANGDIYTTWSSLVSNSTGGPHALTTAATPPCSTADPLTEAPPGVRPPWRSRRWTRRVRPPSVTRLLNPTAAR
jgi:hypothetical protein